MTWQPQNLTPVGRMGIGLGSGTKQVSPRQWWCRKCERKFSSRYAASLHTGPDGCLDDAQMAAAGLVQRGRYGHWNVCRKSGV